MSSRFLASLFRLYRLDSYREALEARSSAHGMRSSGAALNGGDGDWADLSTTGLSAAAFDSARLLPLGLIEVKGPKAEALIGAALSTQFDKFIAKIKAHALLITPSSRPRRLCDLSTHPVLL